MKSPRTLLVPIFAGLCCCAATQACDLPAVFRATYLNDASALSHQLRKGCSPNAKNEIGESLLYVATGPKGGASVVRTLLQAGANPDAGHRKYTPLMNAASWVNLEAVNLLLEAGASPSLRNEDGKSAQALVGRAGGAEAAVIKRLAVAEGAAR